ncbi:MAG: diguanylate cyclase [Eubacterium sp.]|nr:diguanylate cyclase [Eubacterium sp.]
MDNGTLYALLYVEINLVAVILVGIIGVKANGMSKMVAQRNFTMSIGAEILFFFSDTLHVMSVNGVIPQSGAFTMVMKTIYFFSTTLMCYFWFVYFEYMQESPFVENRRRVRISSILVWIMGALLIINVFTGILFYVDEDGYHRGKLFLIQYVLSYAYVLVTCARALVGVFQKSKIAKRKLLILLALFPIAPGIAGIVQFLYPRVPLAAAALSIATLLMYLNWTDQVISVDPLTRLNNRKRLLHSFEMWQNSPEDRSVMYLLMVDADKFKSINDTYGHIEGDAALIRIADALRLACAEYYRKTSISRYGGDEFAVLAWVDVSDGAERVRGLEGNIQKHLEALNDEANTPYRVSVSIGIARSESGDTLEKLIARADGLLYEAKRR